MDDILRNPRPRVNAELLPKFQGKYVTILGKAGPSKVGISYIDIRISNTVVLIRPTVI